MNFDENKLFNIIKDDEIDKFKSLVSEDQFNTFHFNLKDDDAIPDIFKNSPNILHVASYYGSMEILNYLLSKNVDLSQTDSLKRDVSHFAVTGSHLFAIKVLYDHGVDFSHSLVLSAGIGDVYIFKYFVNSLKLDTTIKDSLGSTILHAAALGGNKDLIDFIMSLGTVDINAQDDSGNTPLHIATIYGNVYMVRKLLEVNGINLNEVNNEHKSCLHYAAEKKNPDILQSFLNKIELADNSPSWDFMTLDLMKIEPNVEEVGTACETTEQANFVDVNIADALGFTPFLLAVQNGGNKVIDVFLGLTQTDVMAKTNKGYNCLHIAIQKNRKDILKALVERNDVDVNDTDNEGNSPLLLATEKKNSESAQILLTSKKIDVNISNKKKQTPLHVAAINESKDILVMLLENPYVNIDLKDNNQSTALNYIKKTGNQQLLQLFHEKTEENEENPSNEVFFLTSLHSACKDGNEELCRKLLSNNDTDVNAQDADGWTPLHYACRNSHINCVKLLLEKKNIKINTRNFQGFTALYLAVDSAIRELLISKGASE